MDSHLRNIPVYFFKINALVKEEKSIEGFSIFTDMAAILVNGAERFEQFLVEGHLRNIPVKLFRNLSTDLA